MIGTTELKQIKQIQIILLKIPIILYGIKTHSDNTIINSKIGNIQYKKQINKIKTPIENGNIRVFKQQRNERRNGAKHGQQIDVQTKQMFVSNKARQAIM